MYKIWTNICGSIHPTKYAKGHRANTGQDVKQNIQYEKGSELWGKQYEFTYIAVMYNELDIVSK